MDRKEGEKLQSHLYASDKHIDLPSPRKMGAASFVKSLFTREVFEEAKEQLILAAPAFVAQFCRIAVYIVNGLFLVRLIPFRILKQA